MKAIDNPPTPSRRKFLAGIGVGTASLGITGVAAAQRGGGGNSSGGGRDQPGSDRAPRPQPDERPLLIADDTRSGEALQIRRRAAEQAAARPIPSHQANRDERAGWNYAASFTKGLPHNYDTGLVARNADFEQFVAATDSGRPQDFAATPLGPDDGFITRPDGAVRAWESQGAGHYFTLVGPDPQAVTMVPAPALGSAEVTAEMAEVYAQALVRDLPLDLFRHGAPTNAQLERQLAALNQLEWFDAGRSPGELDIRSGLRRRTSLAPHNAFRGVAPGDDVGPYLSQFLLCGSGRGGLDPADGVIGYGAQTISQRVRYVQPGQDFLTDWDSWFDVQNGLAAGGGESYDGVRFITTGRDLATYVHSDALYQPYFNASLLLFGHGAALDPGMPFRAADDVDHQQGFVLFGGPHVLGMLAEVCSRALKAVKYQKFNVHRRLRPEALAARLEKADNLGIGPLSSMQNRLESTGMLADVREANRVASGTSSVLLPMAFSEGSPMHPSYGAGHGTVAGACATVIKALFDHTQAFAPTGTPGRAYVPNADGSALREVPVLDANGQSAELTVEGEVNKLAANISVGRDWGGVHYFSDYWESMLLGQQIAIQCLEEHMLTIPEQFQLTVPLFEGGTISLST